MPNAERDRLRSAEWRRSRRLVALSLDDQEGRRPVFGSYDLRQTDPAWHDMIPFHEYFHGDTGAGLGASHQTGWPGLVADLIVRAGRGGASNDTDTGESG